MSENNKTDGARTLDVQVRDWLSGGDPDERAKLRVWVTGEDGRWRGYTHSMGRYVTWFMVTACVLHLFIRDTGLILALFVAILLMGGRAMIEWQARCDVPDLEEAKRQWGLIRNPEYLRFMTLCAEGLLEDNKILTPGLYSLLQGYAQRAHKCLEREDKKQAKKARKAEKKARREGTDRESDESADAAAKNEENKAADGSQRSRAAREPHAGRSEAAGDRQNRNGKDSHVTQDYLHRPGRYHRLQRDNLAA